MTVLTPAELQRSAVHGSVWTMVHTLVSLPIAFAANAIVARALGPADYGDLALITTAMAIVGCVSNLGVGAAIQQWGAAAHARGDVDGVDALLRKSLGFHALVQVPVLVTAALVLGWGESDVLVAGLVVAAVVPPLLGSSSLCISIENRTAQASKLAMATNLVSQVSVAAIATTTHSPVAVWAGRNVAGSCLIPANLWLLDRRRRRVVLQPRLPRGLPVGFWRFAMMTSAAGLPGVVLSSRGEILVLERWGSADAVGLYALAFGIAIQLRGPVEALMAPILPSVTGMPEAHPDRVAETLLRTLRIAALVAALLLLTVPGICLVIPTIYGREYSPVAVLMPLLAAVTLCQAFANPLLAMAQGQRLGGFLLAGNVLALAVNAAVAVALIPVIGITGAVLATTSAQLTTVFLLARQQISRHLLSWRQLLHAGLPLWLACVAIGFPVVVSASGTGSAATSGAWLAVVCAWLIALRTVLGESVRAELTSLESSIPQVARPAARALMRALSIPEGGAERPGREAGDSNGR